ncbi:hypothetical protein BH23DEI1_BH23DEI1_13870 [soil metagenome]
MIKLFTLERATRLLPVVEAHLDVLQTSVRDAAALGREATSLRPGGIAARNLANELGFVIHTAHDAKAELDRLGVEVIDAEDGSVAFPAQVGGEMVALTWRRGQDAITHYRRLDGATGTTADERPLAARGDAA